MPENEKPNWQPISFLPRIAEMIDGMLEAVVENQKLLEKAEPASLDNATVSRVVIKECRKYGIRQNKLLSK